MKDLVCVKCEKAMENISHDGHQPMRGLAFGTFGHYGSTYFDPMDGSFLELSICDACVEAADKMGSVYHGRPRPQRHAAAPHPRRAMPPERS